MELAYDITRLVTRLLNLTPNGIDRIDFALAEHFLEAETGRFGILATGLWPRLFPGKVAREAIAAIGAHWGEDKDPESDPGYLEVVARLAGGSARKTSAARTLRIASGRPARFATAVDFFARNGISLGRPPKRDLPIGARYLNVSQFPLWVPAYFEWLESRRDVKAVFFIHDLLPIEMPEYFRAGELERHRRRLSTLARFGAGAIVASEVVKQNLAEYLENLGRRDMPIAAVPIPCSSIFYALPVVEPKLEEVPYFVCCSTIEPRKNHMMLLNIWRELVRNGGPRQPKLVLVGVRGWKYGAIVDLLERSAALSGSVIEVSGLTSPALKRLLDNARALLMPTFGEGYGLPVREALAAGVPVIASDIPAFREIKDERLKLLSPIDGQAWLSAIRSLNDEGRRRFLPAPPSNDPHWINYFARLDAFVTSL